MPQPNFRVVDPDRQHARDLARREVKRFRADAERESWPICNQQDKGGRSLFVDEVIRRTERDMPEVEERSLSTPIMLFIALLFMAIGAVGLVVWLGMNIF